jgi:very-short-patch-repair endonuclease
MTPAQVKRLQAKAKREALENLLAGDMIKLGLPKPKREFRFHKTRRWRFDFVWLDMKLAVEVEGGTESHGRRCKDGKVRKSRHLTPSGFAEDCAKYNAAAIDGWTVLRYTSTMIKSGQAAREIADVLKTPMREDRYD